MKINNKINNKKLILLVLFSCLLLILDVYSKSKTHSKHLNKNNYKKNKQVFLKNLSDPIIENNNIDPFYLQNVSGFKNAQVWPGTLPKHLSSYPYTGEFQDADTISHNNNYYDGSINLAKRNSIINCNTDNLDPQACVKNAGCGWCGSSNACISATPLGPIDPCIRKTFTYSAPNEYWNPLDSKRVLLN